MAFTAPLTVPLTKGVDSSVDPAVGTDDLNLSENVDYSKPGVITGRPGRAAPLPLAYRQTGSGTDIQTSADTTFLAAGFTASGMERLRDTASERPIVTTQGRIFGQEGSRWNDHGPFACARVDRQVNFVNGLDQTVRGNGGQDFGLAKTQLSGGVYYFFFDLLDANGAVQRTVRVSTGGAIVSKLWGGNARCGTTTAVVGVDLSNNLQFYYRTNGGDTITRVNIAANARVPTDIGDAPSICCSADATTFWVTYMTTAANQVVAMRVSITGATGLTYATTYAGLVGVWCDNTSVSTNRLVVGLTGTAGLRIKILDATLMNDAALDSDYAAASGGQEVVVGVESNTTLWWAFRAYGGTGSGDIVIGKASINAGSSATSYRRYYADNSGIPLAGIRWSIGHQPILCNGRMYLTLIAATNNQYTGTWITLDLTNWWPTGPFAYPSPVARGATEVTIPYLAPASAVLLANGETGWTFQSIDWARFDEDLNKDSVGVDGQCGINKVTMSKPRSALFGKSTVFSGSIPYIMQQNQCAELGFPFLSGVPGCSAIPNSGGAVGIGTYGIYAVWRWTDEAGQVHRSSPSAERQVTIPGSGTNTITVYVTSPWITAKVYGTVQIEVYTSAVQSAPITDTGSYYLQKTVTPTFTDGYTSINITTQPVNTTEILYTGGGVYANVHAPADGGVAAMGQRLWLAAGTTLWASKLRVPGQAPGFNDSGALQVDLPAGVGRVISIENMDDKLVAFCTRGVFVVQDGGPNNVGLGPDFPQPVRLSNMGVDGPRSTVATDAGIVFCPVSNGTDPGNGGPWLLDRGMSLSFLGRPIRAQLGTANYHSDLAYSPERQQLFLTTSGGIAMFDLRDKRWSLWTVGAALGTLSFITCVSGVLWSLANEPAPYTGTTGVDSGDGSLTMKVRTSHLPASGRGGMGWSRVRGVRVLGTPSSGTYNLVMTAVLDQATTLTSGTYAMAPIGADTGYPTTRQAPEWRLPQQKCSTLQVQLAATPAVAEWVAVELEVMPLSPTAPAKARS